MDFFLYDYDGSLQDAVSRMIIMILNMLVQSTDVSLRPLWDGENVTSKVVGDIQLGDERVTA